MNRVNDVNTILKLKAYQKEYRERPEIKLKMKQYMKSYIKKYNSTPERKAYMKEYLKSYRENLKLRRISK